MGPLVPSIISNEFNLIIALISGIGFGFALEQAGFSSTKKLVGLFYGYDFTVLKVFFSAGITAMIGVLFFNHLGILDLSQIYINPTFLHSALLGGVIMGLGFIIGGFCPGTSVCAMAIGKLDGLAFVFGSFVGVFAFTELFPYFEEIYHAEAMGPLLINEKLGMSKIVFAFVLTAFAFVAFYISRLVENKVNGINPIMPGGRKIRYITTIGFAFFILFIVAFYPNSQKRIDSIISKELERTDFEKVMVPADKLAREIVNNYFRINIIDLRDTAAFNKYHLPFAINIPGEEIKAEKWKKIINQKNKTNYFYGEDPQEVKKAFLVAEYIGKADNFILKESASDFKAMYSDLKHPGEHASKNEMNIYYFRQKTIREISELLDVMKNSMQPVVEKKSKVKGGC